MKLLKLTETQYRRQKMEIHTHSSPLRKRLTPDFGNHCIHDPPRALDTHVRATEQHGEEAQSLVIGSGFVRLPSEGIKEIVRREPMGIHRPATETRI